MYCTEQKLKYARMHLRMDNFLPRKNLSLDLFIWQVNIPTLSKYMKIHPLVDTIVEEKALNNNTRHWNIRTWVLVWWYSWQSLLILLSHKSIGDWLMYFQLHLLTKDLFRVPKSSWYRNCSGLPVTSPHPFIGPNLLSPMS